MIFTLGACLQEQKKTDLPELGEDMPSRVFVTTEAGAKAALEQAQMRYEGEVQLSDIGFCKVENQQECMIGSFITRNFLIFWENGTLFFSLSTRKTSCLWITAIFRIV